MAPTPGCRSPLRVPPLTLKCGSVCALRGPEATATRTAAGGQHPSEAGPRGELTPLLLISGSRAPSQPFPRPQTRSAFPAEPSGSLLCGQARPLHFLPSPGWGAVLRCPLHVRPPRRGSGELTSRSPRPAAGDDLVECSRAGRLCVTRPSKSAKHLPPKCRPRRGLCRALALCAEPGAVETALLRREVGTAPSFLASGLEGVVASRSRRSRVGSDESTSGAGWRLGTGAPSTRGNPESRSRERWSRG